MYPVYNPLPGSWIAVAYLHKEDENEKLSWLEWFKRKIDIKKCR